MPVLKMFKEEIRYIAFLDNLTSEYYLYLIEGILAEAGIEMASVLTLGKPFNFDYGLT